MQVNVNQLIYDYSGKAINPLLTTWGSVRGQNPKMIFFLLYNKMHPLPSLSYRFTKSMFHCTGTAGGHPLPTPHLCIIPFFAFSSFTSFGILISFGLLSEEAISQNSF